MAATVLARHDRTMDASHRDWFEAKCECGFVGPCRWFYPDDANDRALAATHAQSDAQNHNQAVHRGRR
jgi:hypothetical protein